MAEAGQDATHVHFGRMGLSGAEDLKIKKGAAARTLGDLLSASVFASAAHLITASTPPDRLSHRTN